MSASYQAVGWNRQKKIYDWLIFGFCVLYLLIFCGLTLVFNSQVTFEIPADQVQFNPGCFIAAYYFEYRSLCRISKNFYRYYNRRYLV
jgi:hypothetical protein